MESEPFNWPRKIDNWFQPTNFYSSTDIIYIRFGALEIPVYAESSIKFDWSAHITYIHYVSVISVEHVYTWDFFAPLQFNWNKWELFFLDHHFRRFVFQCLDIKYALLFVYLLSIHRVGQFTYVEFLPFKWEFVCLTIVYAVSTQLELVVKYCAVRIEIHISLFRLASPNTKMPSHAMARPGPAIWLSFSRAAAKKKKTQN